MKEIYEFRINYKFANLLFDANEGEDLGQTMKSVKVVHLTTEDPRFYKIPLISKQIREKYDSSFFYYWEIARKYSKKELEEASLFHIRFKNIFEPAGEECGTEYDETVACEICGSNRRQISSLKLKKGSIPKKDIARTIAGEIIVSEKFKSCFQNCNLKGITFEPVMSGKNVLDVYQPKITSPELVSTEKTMAGINPFDLSESEGGEIYKCPKGHTIGLNLLSEVFVANSSPINEYNLFVTKQKIGVKRGLLRPQPLYLCSQAFRQMVLKEKLSGFDFEVAHIEV
jgi:ribosomal protein S14